MFLHEYLLACEISTVRTHTLSINTSLFIVQLNYEQQLGIAKCNELEKRSSSKTNTY